MKRALRSSLLDLVAGLAAIGLVFPVVTRIHPSFSTIVIYVSLFYMIAGLIRGGDRSTPLLLKLVLLSLFGIVYIPLTGDWYSMSNIPYPVIAVLFSLLGLLIRARWPSIRPVTRVLSITLPMFTIVLLSILFFPRYFDFWATYVHGTAPEFELRTLDGGAVKSSELIGKLILLDYWDTHCGPCVRLMPDMEALYSKYRGNPHVEIIVVNAGWESMQRAREFVSKRGYNLPFAYDEKSLTSRSMNVRELPTTIIIDKHYQYRFKHVGYDPAEGENPVDACSRHIEMLLSE
jgi:cytochrome c biogenesis protein CcmG/thiol:disulfide interchange protein DsbE